MNDMLGTEFVDGLKCCPVCGGATFASKDVLWPELIDSWQLSESEIAYINRQQGFHCKQCNNNLRAMSLAVAIVKEVGFNGILKQFCESGSAVKVIEMNTAGNLTQFLKK
ncbi:hypothetical protein JZU71_01745, partial [bacterium]|nr:hypothetical protein [bacterium]